MMTVAHGFGMLALGLAVTVTMALIGLYIINKREDEDDGHY